MDNARVVEDPALFAGRLATTITLTTIGTTTVFGWWERLMPLNETQDRTGLADLSGLCQQCAPFTDGRRGALERQRGCALSRPMTSEANTESPGPFW